MIIQGKLDRYLVRFEKYAGSYAVIRLYHRKRAWYGLKRWVQLWEVDYNDRWESVVCMYPGEMLKRFTNLVKTYEDYVSEWKAFEAIQTSGVKLEVNDE